MALSVFRGLCVHEPLRRVHGRVCQFGSEFLRLGIWLELSFGFALQLVSSYFGVHDVQVRNESEGNHGRGGVSRSNLLAACEIRALRE